MIEQYKIKGLQKLVNTELIKKVYPMIDFIELEYDPERPSTHVNNFNTLTVNVILNDPTINKKNMYEKGFDPHYLIDYHIKRYKKLFEIDDVNVEFFVWAPDGKIIDYA